MNRRRFWTDGYLMTSSIQPASRFLSRVHVVSHGPLPSLLPVLTPNGTCTSQYRSLQQCATDLRAGWRDGFMTGKVVVHQVLGEATMKCHIFSKNRSASTCRVRAGCHGRLRRAGEPGPIHQPHGTSVARDCGLRKRCWNWPNDGIGR